MTNEWFIRDTSRKIRAVLKAKAERGERLGTRAPYGYIKDPETKKLAVDDEAAAIVRRIFAMCASGNGPSQIARILKKEQVLTVPSRFMRKIVCRLRLSEVSRQ